ncbi:MAG TPA: hypothetical protein DEW39_08935 [Brevibacterium sp.]|nr:hypothetical protein [Brevibacterium sp.]
MFGPFSLVGDVCPATLPALQISLIGCQAHVLQQLDHPVDRERRAAPAVHDRSGQDWELMVLV